MADRANGSHDFDTKTEHIKLFRSKDKKSALAIGGPVGFKMSRETIDLVFAEFRMAAISPSFDSEEMKECFTKMRDDAIKFLETIRSRGGIIIHHDPHYRFYFDESCDVSTGPKVIADNAFIAYGSGGQMAITLHALGYTPEEIAKSIPEIDEYSNDKFDIIYTKELSK